MTVDVDINWLTTIALAVGGMVATLYTKAVNAENRTLKMELEGMKRQHTNDILRIDETHKDIWEEMKSQREALHQNREAVIRLNASIERLNDILPRLEQVVMGMASSESRHRGRRATDLMPDFPDSNLSGL
jgi:hypothetical protein